MLDQQSTSRSTSKSVYRYVGIVIIGLMLIGFIGLMAVGLINPTSVTEKSGVTRVNKPAPDFTLELFNGEEVVLSQYLGTPVVINFWASWCPPCHEEAILIENMWQSYRDQGIFFVGVDIQDTEQDAMAFLENFNITYPNGLDLDGHITIDYGVIGLPVTFFINSDGIVEGRWVGAIDHDRLHQWVQYLLAGQDSFSTTTGQNLN